MANIAVDIIANDKASKTLAGFGKSVEGMAKNTGVVGGAVTAMVGFALAGVVRLASGFQEATDQLVTGAGESVKNIDKIRAGLEKMAPAVGMGPEALAKGMFMVESAGYHGAEGLKVMQAAAEGAKVGGAEAAVVADGLTTAMKDYAIPAAQAGVVTSKLIETVALGKTHMQDLSMALGTVLPLAASLKIGFNDIMGAMSTMTGQGIDAATASTNLKFAMMALTKETPAGAKELEDLGLSAKEVGDSLSQKGLSGTLAMITEAIGKKFPAGSAEYNKALAEIVGGTRGMGAALALTGIHAKELTSNIAKISGASTEAGGHVKGWGEVQKDFNTQVGQASAKLQVMAINVGTALFPAMQSALAVASQWLGVLTANKPVLFTLVGVIGTLGVVLLATSIAARVMLAVSTLSKIATLAWAAATFAANVAAGVFGITTKASMVASYGQAAATTVSTAAQKGYAIGLGISRVATAIATAAQWAWNAALDANPIGLVIILVAALVAAVIWLIANWKTVGPFFAQLWSNITRFFTQAWENITRGISEGWNAAMSFLRGIPGAILGFFAGIGNSLFNMGRNMIQGLLNGAASLLRGIGNFFLSILPGWIVAPFKAALGINSPSTVFFGHGQNIVQGLVNGITSSKGAVADAMSSLVPAPTMQGMSLGRAAAGGAAGAAGASGGLYIDKFIGGSASAAEIASEMGWIGRWKS